MTLLQQAFYELGETYINNPQPEYDMYSKIDSDSELYSGDYINLFTGDFDEQCMYLHMIDAGTDYKIVSKQDFYNAIIDIIENHDDLIDAGFATEIFEAENKLL